MKGKNVFFALGLALTMGVGVVAAVANAKEFSPAKAETETTLYCAIDSTTLSTYTLKLNVNRKGDGDDWAQYEMIDTGDTYESKKVFTKTFTDLYNGLGCIQFQLWDGETHKGQEQPFGTKEWTSPSVYNGKMWVYGGDASWHTYTPSVTYQVDVYVDGAKRGTETIAAHGLPVPPTLTEYGKGFTGWYSNIDLSGPEVTEITSDTSVYGEIINLPEWSYSVDASRVPAFNDLYFYAFESNDRKNDPWPGVKMNSNSFIVPNDATIVIANGDSSVQTVDITQSFVANDVIRILNSTDLMGHYEYVWTSTLDEPAEEGYYVVGVGDNWDFDNATQMLYNGGAALDANGNIAICDGITVEAGDEIKVRSFFNEADAWYAPADGQSYTFGAKVSEGDDNSNFRFTTGGTYDVYFKEGYFYLSTHHERHTIGVVDQLFTGRTKTSFDNGTSQLAEEGSPFYPASPSRAGYTFINFYTDSACTTLYEAVNIEFDTTLHAKFVKNEAYDDNDGVYVVGDATFTGNVNFAWDIQGAVLLADAVNDTEKNLYEGTITIPNSASNEHPVQIRPAFYDGSLDYAHATCSLGQAYSFVTKPEDNFVFTRGGVYAVYVNKSLEVYFNTGEDAFYTQFLTEIGAVCNAQGGTDLEALAAAWANQKTAFVALGDANTTFIYAAGIDAGNETGSDMQKVIAKYKYIVTKYGTVVCEDFIWGETYAATSNNFSLRTVTQNSNVLVITLVTITVVAVGAVAAYALLKKKKER